jgi:hypothetical protein
VAVDFKKNVWCHFDDVLEELNLQTLHVWLCPSYALFLIDINNGVKCCTLILETISIHVPTRNICNFSTFSLFSNHCLSAKCAFVANAVCKFIDMFRKL